MACRWSLNKLSRLSCSRLGLLYSINEEGKVSSITEYLSDLLFVKQLYGQEICGEKKTMEQL